MIYWVRTIANRYSAVWSNSAVRFGRLVVYFRPSGFYLFGRPVSAVWASLFFNSVRQANRIQSFPPPPPLSTGRARGTNSKPLSIHQINLRKSQVPTANMVQKFSKSKNFLIMAQEPWCAGRGLAGLAPSMVRHSHTTLLEPFVPKMINSSSTLTRIYN